MKIFTTGTASWLPTTVQEALGLPSHVRQGRVLVSAQSKVTAFLMLTDRRMAPHSPRDSEFRQAMGNDVNALSAAGLFDKPVVLATTMLGGGPVAQVGTDGVTVIGKLVPAANYGYVFEPATAELAAVIEDRKLSAANLSALTAATVVKLDEVVAETVLAQMAANTKRVAELNDELDQLRLARQELALHARQLKIVDPASRVLDVTPARVSQLADAALVERADRTGLWPVGTRVQIQDRDRDPENYPYAVVVDRPAGRVAPNSRRWVWVRYACSGDVCPVRHHDVLPAREQ